MNLKITTIFWYLNCIVKFKLIRVSYFQGLAITFASDENDTKILNEVQNRFDVNITELPDEIDLSSYSKILNSHQNQCFIITKN